MGNGHRGNQDDQKGGATTTGVMEYPLKDGRPGALPRKYFENYMTNSGF